jgi:hypothetical protein
MKDFEKFLTDLPKPAVDVPAFRDQLRRELASAAPTDPSRRWRFAAIGMTAIATGVVFALGLFIAHPGIPADLNAALIGQRSAVGERLDDSRTDRLPGRLEMPVEADRAFADRWVAQQASPVAIRSMSGERLVSVRQFDLTDGEQMLVFTEMGTAEARPEILRAGSTAQFF